ncbi:hypothetical protein ACWEWI_25440 [Streptomyces sp. NPDC003753]
MSVGPFTERAHTRPGDDHGPDVITVALQNPGVPYTPYGARYRKLGWLRCETDKILGLWNPAYLPLTHAAAGLDLPHDVGLEPAHYAVFAEARKTDGKGYTLLRLGRVQKGSAPLGPRRSEPRLCARLSTTDFTDPRAAVYVPADHNTPPSRIRGCQGFEIRCSESLQRLVRQT